MMNRHAPLSVDAETARVEEPLPGQRPSGSASVVERRDLGFAQTAVSGRQDQGPTHDSLISGATLRGEARGEATVPDRIGRFLVLGRLGSGGMGVVVEAYDPELDRKVAIKLLKSDRARSDSQARLLREAQAMARLSHPNVVQVYDVGLVGEQVFVAMELVVGENLAQWLAAGPRPWREVIALFIAAGRGLAAAHAVGLVHRDFKPDNVLLADDGRVRVADFGLAREDRAALAPASEAEAREERLLADTLTATGVLMGTPMYMSPEQHRAEPVGPRSDIFSFSVALFEALYGVRPFAGETMAQLTRNVLSGTLVAIPERRSVPAWLDSAVRRGLSVEIEARYPSFAEYLLALGRDPSRSRRRWLGAGALGLSAALLGGALHASGAGTPSCTAGAEALAEVWNEDIAAHLRERLQLLPEGARAAIEPRLLGGLDDYASAWIELERQACEGHLQGDRSDALFDAQERCLDRRRAALGGAVELLLHDADGATLREATMVVAKLPPVAYCGDRDALLAEVAPPESPAAMAVVAGLRDRLTQAELLAHAGRTDEALGAIAALAPEVETADYAPLSAELALAEGRIALDGRDGPRALAALDQSFLRATEVGADALALEAKARALYVRGLLLGDAEALGERPYLEALSAHVGRDDLTALVANNSGAILAATGDTVAARQLFRSAVELSRDDPLTRPVDYAGGYLKNLALVSDQPEERARLFTEVASTLEATLSPAHTSVIDLRFTQAMLTSDPELAAERFTATCPLLADHPSQTLYLNCVGCYLRLGHVEDELGRSDRAAAAMSSGLACLEGPIAEEDREVVAAWRALLRGQMGLFQGAGDDNRADDNRAAAQELAEARRLMEPHREAWWIALLLADVDLADGRRLASSDPAAAIPHLEAAIAGFEPLRDRAFDRLPSYGLARAQVTLAEALIAEVRGRGAAVDGGRVDSDRTPPGAVPDERDLATRTRRAKSLVDAAEAYYRGAGPSYTARLAELNTWREGHLR